MNVIVTATKERAGGLFQMDHHQRDFVSSVFVGLLSVDV